MSGSTSTTTSGGTGQFQIANGQIINPNGSVFAAQGINLYDSQMGDASDVLADFPDLNFIRLNVYSYQSPSAYSAFIQTMTSHGVVVELEDHTNSTGSDAGGGVGSAFTGSQLTNELNWYSSVASAYASNPYVWFGTDNEPPQTGLSTWEQETYNAIRGAGNNNPIMMELPGGGDPGSTVSNYGMNPSVYASMSNIVLDAHFYGWGSGFSTNQQTVDSSLTSLVQGAQTITSANGTVPVIIGEYGPSTDGSSTDANSSEVLQAVQSSTATSGSVAWGWDTGANDNLTSGDGTLTSYGQEVAQWMASTGTTPTTSTATPTPTSTATPSANDTTVISGSPAAITDASGNEWTIASNGEVAVNGVDDTTTANVTELAYVNGTIWQENSNDLWWGKTSPTASWSPSAGTATSPLPAAVTIAPNSTSATVSQSEITAAATSGTNILFVQGSNDVVDLSGGTNTVSDTGSANTYVLPAAGNGSVDFTSNILNTGDTLDLKPALAATNWDGTAGTLANYLQVTDSSKGAVLSIASTSGGTGTAIATISGATTMDLSTVLAHSIT
jgi:hypothetical protein